MHYRRLQLQEELGTGFEDIIDDHNLLTKAQMRDQMQKFKRFSKFIDDDLDTGLNKG